jgi:hypothetical protein
MLLEITESERNTLMELVDSATRTIVHELDHTDTREYRRKLQDRMRVLEHISKKMQEPHDAQEAKDFCAL